MSRKRLCSGCQIGTITTAIQGCGLLVQKIKVNRLEHQKSEPQTQFCCDIKTKKRGTLNKEGNSKFSLQDTERNCYLYYCYFIVM